MRTDRLARRALFILPLSALLAACVSSNRPERCDEAEVTIEIAVTADAMRPDDPAVCRGQEVTLVIDPTPDGYLHIHGYDEAVPIIEITGGEQASVEFTADRSGQFPVELHLREDPAGIGIGIFTVHEP